MVNSKYYGYLSFIIVNFLPLIVWVTLMWFRLLLADKIIPIVFAYFIAQPFLIFASIYFNRKGESLKVVNYVFIVLNAVMYLGSIGFAIYVIKSFPME